MTVQAPTDIPDDDRPAEEFCGYCKHHMDPHDYSGTGVDVPCSECPGGICPRDKEDPHSEAFDLFEGLRPDQGGAR